MNKDDIWVSDPKILEKGVEKVINALDSMMLGKNWTIEETRAALEILSVTQASIVLASKAPLV